MVSSFGSVVFLERRFCISKVDSSILLKTSDLFLARQVFALHVNTHFAQEFLLVVGVLEFQHFHIPTLVVFIGCLSARVSKFIHPKLTSLGGEDRGGGGCGLRCSGRCKSLVGESDVRRFKFLLGFTQSSLKIGKRRLYIFEMLFLSTSQSSILRFQKRNACLRCIQRMMTLHKILLGILDIFGVGFDEVRSSSGH